MTAPWPVFFSAPDRPCRGRTDLFFGADPDLAKGQKRSQLGIDRAFEAAKALCRTCPHLAPCRQWALDHPDERGVWGATTEQERRHLRADQ